MIIELLTLINHWSLIFVCAHSNLRLICCGLLSSSMPVLENVVNQQSVLLSIRYSL